MVSNHNNLQCNSILNNFSKCNNKWLNICINNKLNQIHNNNKWCSKWLNKCYRICSKEDKEDKEVILKYFNLTHKCFKPCFKWEISKCKCINNSNYCSNREFNNKIYSNNNNKQLMFRLSKFQIIYKEMFNNLNRPKHLNSKMKFLKNRNNRLLILKSSQKSKLNL